MKKNQPEFVDIWILIKGIKDPEQRKKIEELDKLSQQNLSNWQSQMLYPYIHKFLFFDDIKDSLTGYGRFIYYRAMCKVKSPETNDVDFDPTHEGNTMNWLSSIKEGRFNKG